MLNLRGFYMLSRRLFMARDYSDIYTLRIEKDKNIIKYIKIIREYDNNLSMADIKKAIEQGTDVVVCDFDEYEPLEPIGFAEKKFKKLRKNLKKAGAKIKVFHEGMKVEDEEMSTIENSRRAISLEVEAERELEVDDVDMEKIQEFSNLWDDSEPGWVVLKLDEYDYSIFNKITKMYCLIEDEDLNNQVAAMMIMQGTEVIDDKGEIDKLLKG